MLTDNDIKRIEQALVPKLEQALVPKLLKAFAGVFATKEDLENLKEAIEEKLTVFRGDIMSHVDAVYKELLAKRDEQTMHQGSHLRMQDTIDDHGNRIKKLESSTATS